MSRDSKHLLLTGPPGCGKTTVVQQVVKGLGDVPSAGFYTRELRLDGRRVGFEAVGLNGEVVTLAHVDYQTQHRVGRYGVDAEAFDRVVQAELIEALPPPQLFVIDEIGKMECFSDRFVAGVRRILEGDVPLLATVALRGSGLISEVKQRHNVELMTVTLGNRSELPDELLARLDVSG